MKNTKGVIILLIVLLAGMLLGASGAVLYYEQHFQTEIGRRPPHLHSPQEKAERLARILGLDQAQQEKALAIITKHESEVDAMHAQVKTTLDKVLDEVSQELSPILTPEQRSKLEAFVRDIKSRRFPPRADGPDFGPGRGPGHGPDRGPGPAPEGPGGPGPEPRQ
jgi:hypothetical protein